MRQSVPPKQLKSNTGQIASRAAEQDWERNGQDSPKALAGWAVASSALTVKTELKLWRENETGAADFLHACWMGRYYGHIKSKE